MQKDAQITQKDATTLQTPTTEFFEFVPPLCSICFSSWSFLAQWVLKIPKFEPKSKMCGTLPHQGSEAWFEGAENLGAPSPTHVTLKVPRICITTLWHCQKRQ